MPIAVHGVTGMAFIKGLIHLTGGGTAQGGSSGSTIHQVYKPTMSCKSLRSFKVQKFKKRGRRGCLPLFLRMLRAMFDSSVGSSILCRRV